MDGSLLVLVLLALALVVLDVAALRFGVDSRPKLGERPDW